MFFKIVLIKNQSHSNKTELNQFNIITMNCKNSCNTNNNKKFMILIK